MPSKITRYMVVAIMNVFKNPGGWETRSVEGMEFDTEKEALGMHRKLLDCMKETEGDGGDDDE